MYVSHNNVYEHRSVAELALGRALPQGAVVHHADLDKSNNDPSNLVICPDQAYHRHLHARLSVVAAGYDPNTHKRCSYCKTYHTKSEFSTSPSNYDGLNATCRRSTNEYRRSKGIKSVWNWRRSMNQQFRRAKEVCIL